MIANGITKVALKYMFAMLKTCLTVAIIVKGKQLLYFSSRLSSVYCLYSINLLYITEDERHSASVTFYDTTDSASNTATMSGEQHEMLSLEELRPFQNPEQALRECTQSLSNPDWCVCVVCVLILLSNCAQQECQV